jgi:hypothetical protein
LQLPEPDFSDDGITEQEVSVLMGAEPDTQEIPTSYVADPDD